MPRNLATLCASILCKLELINDDVGFLVKEILKQSVEETAWFFLTVHSKMQKERNEERGVNPNKKEPELEDLGNFNLSIL